MMTKYGFGSDQGGEKEQLQDISLPEPKRPGEKPSQVVVREAAQEGRALGFVSREPSEVRGSGGGQRYVRKRKAEPQDKLMVTGPSRVLDDFKEFCDQHDAKSYCAGLEILLSAYKKQK